MGMNVRNYELLGLDENATDEEILSRYQELKAKYKEDRWLDGEEGNEAAKMLNKLDVAYTEIMSERKEKEQNTDGESAYEEVATLLKEGNINDAQAKLDAFNERGAEWHYLQAVVFYKKNWSNESKKQLEIAMQMDPENKKYRVAYGKLNEKNEYEKRSATPPQDQGYAEAGGEQMGGSACSSCIDCCFINLCVNCLFNMCCGCR